MTTSKITGSSNTIHVTLDFDSIYDCKLEDVSMEQLVPGTKVDVSLIKVPFRVFINISPLITSNLSKPFLYSFRILPT